jgi:hypothetical protein
MDESGFPNLFLIDSCGGQTTVDASRAQSVRIDVTTTAGPVIGHVIRINSASGVSGSMTPCQIRMRAAPS